MSPLRARDPTLAHRRSHWCARSPSTRRRQSSPSHVSRRHRMSSSDGQVRPVRARPFTAVGRASLGRERDKVDNHGGLLDRSAIGDQAAVLADPPRRHGRPTLRPLHQCLSTWCHPADHHPVDRSCKMLTEDSMSRLPAVIQAICPTDVLSQLTRGYRSFFTEGYVRTHPWRCCCRPSRGSTLPIRTRRTSHPQRSMAQSQLPSPRSLQYRRWRRRPVTWRR